MEFEIWESAMVSTIDIAASLLRIYKIFQAIGYISPEDIKLPPHDEGAIDIALCESVGMDDATIYFLKRIPWATAGAGDLIKNSEIIDFSNEYCVRQSRHFCDSSVSGSTVDGPREVDGSLISLTMSGQHGRSLVVDISRGRSSPFPYSRPYALDRYVDIIAGTIRIWDGKGDVLAVEEQNACAVLDAMYNRYYNLEEIPFELCILAPITDQDDVAERRVCVFCGDELPPRSHSVAEARVCALCGRDLPTTANAVENNNRYEMVKWLAQQCGWPEHFDVEAFKAAASELPSPSKTESSTQSSNGPGSSDRHLEDGIIDHDAERDSHRAGSVIDHQGEHDAHLSSSDSSHENDVDGTGTLIREWVHDQADQAGSD
ncbi:hypothetical protein EDD36DRAFT_474357 [Exophiala viscosa]|uniref:Uncharacterized protein n=1 Tax=Exophiala viscosa TaxID=2486360 RepID=A0AAN6DZZ2_9EURO|nr:hypothetical protein EDD36DRAFT_474357 [Exophiala viscosa]